MPNYCSFVYSALAGNRERPVCPRICPQGNTEPNPKIPFQGRRWSVQHSVRIPASIL